MSEIDKYSTVNLIQQALKAEWTDNYGQSLIPTYLRDFYRFKTVVCLLLNWEPSRDADLHYDAITIAGIDGGVSGGSVHGPEVYWGVMLKVGYGVRRNWWATLHDEVSD